MKKCLLLAIIFISTVSYCQNEAIMSFTLEECLEYAFGNSYERKNMEISKKSQELSYEYSKYERLPSVSASLNESFSNNSSSSDFSGNVGISAGMPIYQGGQINRTIEQEKLKTEQSEVEIRQYDDQLSIQILQSFLTILGNKELLKYQMAVLESSREAMKQGQEKYKVGAILESDYLLLAAQYASDTNNIIDTQITITNNLLSLKTLLSMDPLENLDIISPDTTLITQLAVIPPIDEVISQSLSYSPELRIMQYDIDIAKSSLQSSKSGYLPSVNLSAGINSGHRGFENFGTQFGDNLSENIGLSVNIPIYSRGETKLRVKQSELSLERSELLHEEAILTLRQEIAQEYHNLTSTYNKYNVSNLTQEAYYKSFQAYNVQFSHGTITAVELLQQQNSYLNALNNYIQNKYSFILQRKILDVYMGKSIVM